MTVHEQSALANVVLRFAGDSGDGMQLTGERFTSTSALFGNDLATLPDFPAEIRAPAGTLGGVSSFQIQIASHDVTTAGDSPNVLVAMNPAGLRANLHLLLPGAVIIVNGDSFDERSLARAGYHTNPLEDGSLDAFNVTVVPMTTLTTEACREAGVKPRDAERSKNFFALGLVLWTFSRSTDATLEWIDRHFATRPTIASANRRALHAGYDFGETMEMYAPRFDVAPAPYPPGDYTNITGSKALAWGFIAAAHRAGLPLFLGSYPITPASDILHELATRKEFEVTTFQAEDEIAAIGAAIGAAYGGAIGLTTTSGPGLDLKSEAIGLAISLELPLIIVDVQRAGPSTGMPTKVEQGDLSHALYGRHGETPLPVLAALTPSQCFDAAIEAVRIAVTYRTPVVLLSDAALANATEPWRIPGPDELPVIRANFAGGPNHVDPDGTATFRPFLRDATTLARPWAPPGVAGLEHRIGGLEKADELGHVSYDGANHERMTELRAAKIAGVATSYPPLVVDDLTDTTELLIVGWGGTYGSIAAGVALARQRGISVAHLQLRHLNPLPRDLGEILQRYRRVLVAELNLGQLARLLRAEYLVDVATLHKMRGAPFTSTEIADALVRTSLELL
jgi:2-oxoglutarate ferredoxin oxidoreductase subunit alpha